MPADTVKMTTNRHWLRGATRADHEAVEAGMARFDPATPSGYALFLQVQAQAVSCCEAILEHSAIERLIPDWPARRRLPAIERDLRSLGLDPPVQPRARAAIVPAAAAGLIYVLEGSRLGGVLLAKRLQQNPCERCRAADDFLRHGEGNRLWTSFTAWLDDCSSVSADRSLALDGARSGFALFSRAAASVGGAA